jgi:hypothetical protein
MLVEYLYWVNSVCVADDVFDSQEASEREALHPHLKHSRGQEPCDHCIYFKGIAWRVLNSHREDPTKAPLPDTATIEGEEPAADIPARVRRSLESIAIEEEKTSKAQQEKYLHWCETSQAKVPIEPGLARKPKRKYAADTESTYLHNTLNSMNKDQLIAWRKQKNQDVDSEDIRDMQYQSMEEIREHIIKTRGTVVPQTKKAKLSDGKVLKAPSGVVIWGKQALAAWYEKNKAPELKAEVSRRGLWPVPTKKADMVEVLVRHNLKG